MTPVLVFAWHVCVRCLDQSRTKVLAILLSSITFFLLDVFDFYTYLAVQRPVLASVAVCSLSRSPLRGCVQVNVCNYLANRGATVLPCVKAGIAISGAFSLDFMSFARYKDVYQPVIVPNLLNNILSMFRPPPPHPSLPV